GERNSCQRHDVGSNTECIQQDEACGNRYRDLDDYAQGASPMEKKQEDDQRYDDHFLDECRLDRRDRFFNEFAPVVDDVKRNTFRKASGHVFHLAFDGFDDLVGVLSITHHHDATDDFPFTVQIKNAEAGFTRHLYCAHVADGHGHAVDGGEWKPFDFLDRLKVAAGLHDISGAAHFKLAATGFVVVRTDSSYHFRNRQAVVSELVRVKRHLVLLLKSTERRDFTYARRVLQREFYIPVLQRPLFTQVHAGRVEGILEYVTDTSPIGSQRRCDTLRQQSRCVVKTFENALSRPVDVCVIIEDHVDETHVEHGGA